MTHDFATKSSVWFSSHLFVCVSVFTWTPCSARSSVCVPKGQQLKSPLAITCVCSLQCYFWVGWPFHTAPSPWTMLCWQDNMDTRERSALTSKWGTRGNHDWDREVSGGMLGKPTVGWTSSVWCSFSVEICSEAICGPPCLLLLNFMTHLFGCVTGNSSLDWCLTESDVKEKGEMLLRKMFVTLCDTSYLLILTLNVCYLSAPLPCPSRTWIQVMSADKQRDASWPAFSCQTAVSVSLRVFVASQTQPLLSTWWQEFLPAQGLM